MSGSMMEYLEEIESWMEQVRDDDISADDYEFLESLVHGGSKRNGNDGLANVGAYLAIYEEEGELEVDEQLLDALDEKQSEMGYGGERFSNIVHGGSTKKRDGNTLLAKGVDGHRFLQELIDEYRKEVNTNSSPPSHESILKDGVQNQKLQSSKGGENSMADDQYNHQRNTLAGAVSRHDDVSSDLVHAAAVLERKEGTLDAAVDLINEYRDESIYNMRSVQSYLDKNVEGGLQAVMDVVDDMNSAMDSFESEIDSFDGGPSDASADALDDATGYDGRP